MSFLADKKAMLFVLISCLVIAGCGEEPVSKAPVAKPHKVKPAVVETKKNTAGEDGKNKAVFTYNPIGKRDPFESLIQKEKEAQNAQRPKTPLEKFDLGQFRIQAILIGKGEPRAMVSAPDGKNYILKPGLKIGKNNGVIKTITRNAILVEESGFDIAGNPVKGIQSLTIPVKEKL